MDICLQLSDRWVISCPYQKTTLYCTPPLLSFRVVWLSVLKYLLASLLDVWPWTELMLLYPQLGVVEYHALWGLLKPPFHWRSRPKCEYDPFHFSIASFMWTHLLAFLCSVTWSCLCTYNFVTGLGPLRAPSLRKYRARCRPIVVMVSPRVGYRLNLIDSDSAYRFRLFSIPSFDSSVIK